MGERVNIEVPEDIMGLFRWHLRNSPQFNGQRSAIVEHFFVRGITSDYEEQLAKAEPLPKELQDFFTKSAMEALDEVLKQK